MRPLLIAVFLITSSVFFAQRQNVYFLKEDNSLVDNKDSADEAHADEPILIFPGANNKLI